MSEQSKLPYRIESITITKRYVTVHVSDGAEDGAALFISRPKDSGKPLDDHIADIWRLLAERVSVQFGRAVLEEHQS